MVPTTTAHEQELVSLERAKIKLALEKAVLNLEKTLLKTLTTQIEAEEKKQAQIKANQLDYLERNRELSKIRDEEFARWTEISMKDAKEKAMKIRDEELARWTENYAREQALLRQEQSSAKRLRPCRCFSS